MQIEIIAFVRNQNLDAARHLISLIFRGFEQTFTYIAEDIKILLEFIAKRQNIDSIGSRFFIEKGWNFKVR